jgi:hypothetical protein
MGFIVRWTVWRALGLALTVTLAFGNAGRAAPADDQRIRDAVSSVYDWAGYQRDLPGKKEAPKPHPLPNPGPADIGPFAEYILFGLIGVVLVIIVLYLISGGWRRSQSDSGPAAPDESTPGTTRREQLKERLQSADQEAGGGDWSGAIHILLLTSIDLLRRRVGQDVPAAMTSRELVGEARLPEPTREDFAALVAAAELCHFGGRPADQSLYERCRTHYERLWGMAPGAPA